MPETAQLKPLDGVLSKLDRELAAGDGTTYKRLLCEDAVVVVPSRVLDKGEAIAEVDEAGGWDDFQFADEREERLGPDAAWITYRFSGHRGVFEYDAQLSSIYRREEDGSWRLQLHQQTSLE